MTFKTYLNMTPIRDINYTHGVSFTQLYIPQNIKPNFLISLRLSGFQPSMCIACVCQETSFFHNVITF